MEHRQSYVPGLSRESLLQILKTVLTCNRKKTIFEISEKLDKGILIVYVAMESQGRKEYSHFPSHALRPQTRRISSRLTATVSESGDITQWPFGSGAA